MPATIEVKPALRKFLDAEADAALIDLVDQVVASKRNGYEREIDARLQGIRNWATQRFAATDKRQKLILRKFNNGLQQMANELKLHLAQALAEADAKNEQRFGGIDAKFGEFNLKNEKRLGETDTRNEQRFGELRLNFEKRFNEAELNNQRRFAEIDAKDEQRAADIKLYLEKRFGEIEKRFGELEVKSAERQAGLMKWMITFFVGLLFTLAGLMLAYLQLLGKP